MKVPLRRSARPSENAPAWVATLTALIATYLANVLDPELAYAAAGAVGLVLGVLAQRYTFPWDDLRDHGEEAAE